jgi:hypothetical protein
MHHPLFCPNPDCSLHLTPPAHRAWYCRDGHYQSRLHGPVQRYRCRQCGIHFSSQTFSLDYGVKRRLPYHRIFSLLISSSGIRDIGRILKASPTCITNRLSRLARQALAVHADLLSELLLTEDLVADGFESFAVSQYFPNNIQVLLGKKSQFWIFSDYAHLRRKGRMTDRQRLRNEVLQKLFICGRVTTYESFEELVRMVLLLLEQSGKTQVTLYTDKHKSYARVIENLRPLDHARIMHRRSSSSLPRTVANDLFSVNYIDREIRKDLAEHTRETVQFARNVVNQMERLAIYRAYHNYIKPYRIRGTANEKCSHAEKAGIPGSSIGREMKTFFTQRRFLSRSRIGLLREVNVWLRSVSTPLRRGIEAYPGYVLS